MKQVVSVQLPRNISGKVRENLLADPTVVRLRDRSPYFYEIGLSLSQLVPHDDAVTLPTVVRVALAARMTGILDFALNSLHEDVSSFSGQLTDYERSVFATGLQYAKDRANWKRKTASRMQPSAVILSTQRTSMKRRRDGE